MVPNAPYNGEEAAPAAWGSVGGALPPSSPPPLRDPARHEGTVAQLLGSWRTRPNDCTELVLSRCRLDRLSGLDALVNLEVLFVSGNRLRALTGLDANVRLRELYAEGNELCTLRGSLPRLRHLSHLDLSSNALRDLPKLLARLRRLQRLRQLNLAGNPCCEEPDYRLTVVHSMPWLEVLDCHCVTDAERRRARAVVGGDVAALTVAFGRRAQAGGAWRAQTAGRSVLEIELGQTAARVREARRAARERAESEAYAANPDAGFWAPKASLPPPPGVLALTSAAAQQRPGQVGAAGFCSGGCGGAAATREPGAAGLMAADKGGGGTDVFVVTIHQSCQAAAAGGAAPGRAGQLGKPLGRAAPHAAARAAGAREEPAAVAVPPAATVAHLTYAPHWTLRRVAVRL